MRIGTKDESGFLINESGLVHLRVRDKLREKVYRMKPGDKLPPERKLSEIFNVARPTIRRAIQNLEEEGCVVRQQGRGTFVSTFQLGDKAATKSKTVGLIIPDVEIPYHARIMKGVEEESLRQGYAVQVSNIFLSPSTSTEDVLERVSQQELAGILVYPIDHDPLDLKFTELISEIQRSGTKVVLLCQYVPSLNVPVAMVDKVQEGYIATEHLIMLGHRKICYASSNTFDINGNDSYRGYRQAHLDYEIEFDPELHIDFPVLDSEESTYDAVKKILTHDPKAFTAIATPQICMTRSIMKALSDLGKKVPEDIAVVGSEVYQIPELAHLTHTLEPAQGMGREGVKLLLSDNNEPMSRKKHSLLQPKLVIGKTCGTY